MSLQGRIAEAYRWHRRLGASVVAGPSCHIVYDPAHPQVWDRNHADDVTARTPAEIDAVFAAMDARLAHTPWRVVHTDGFTPDAFLARLAFEDYAELPTTIQMALEVVPAAGRVPLDPIESEADWATFGELFQANLAEGRTTGGRDISDKTRADLLAGHRSKAPACRFHLVRRGGVALAYGAAALAPNGVGMIEEIFTAPAHRGQGVASGMIAALAADLRAQGADVVFLGALAGEAAKRLYGRLGFRPVALARAWVKSVR